MFNTKISRAVALAISGAVLSLAASSASAAGITMYNLTTAGGADNSTPSTTPCAPCQGGVGTDGWVWGFGGTPQGATNSVAAWAGTAATNTTPFGYNGGTVLHWAVELNNHGDVEISNADSIARYGVSADIDTAKGAWSDAANGTGASGWRHDLDFGLLKSDVALRVTLNASGINQVGTNFGFTVFKGMASGTGAYNHHGGWNANNNTQVGAPNAASLPGGGFNLPASAIVAYSIGGATPSNLNTISFDAEAGQLYTIVLGGYKNGSWGDTTDGYRLSISAVPEPASLSLFAVAFAGMRLSRRRQR